MTFNYTSLNVQMGFQRDGFSHFGDEYYILNSWRRCQELGIDPYISGQPTYLNYEQISRRLKANINLVNIAEPILKEAYRLAAHHKLVLSLLDVDGYILIVTGDAEAIYQYTGVNYVPGMHCGEKTIGTNCFSLVMQSGRPFSIAGMEHYCQRYHYVACSAAPIKNESGNIIGVVVMDEIEGEVSNCSQGVVGVAAKAIETGIQMQMAQEQMSFTNRLQSMIVESISDGLLKIDAHGIVTHMNANGARILNVMTRNCIGKHISDVVDFEPVVLNALKTEQGYVDKEFRLESKRGELNFVKTAILLRDDHGQLNGVVEIFREIKRIRKKTNQMIGAKAIFTLDDILGESAPIVNMRRLAKLTAASETTVLLEGESGTGKELLAQAIHNCSYRSEGPFVAINCGAIPRELMESELFGYEEGAFTGAKNGGRAGKFEMAHGGTLLLDEVSEMPFDMQVKLLRVLQQNQIIRVGGSQVVSVDARIIVATNRNLWQMVQEGKFREDLYYRLNVMDILLPPLRDRTGDVPLLIQHFLHKCARRDGRLKNISPAAMKLLMNWHWPGNVRELENSIEHACCLSENDATIEVEHLPRNIQNNECVNRLAEQTMSLKEAERAAIENVIQITQGNVSQSAKLLGIGRNTLYEKLKEYSISYKFSVGGVRKSNCVSYSNSSEIST